jgi:hypothetical protein
MEYTFRQVLSRPDKEGRCRIVLDVTWAGKREKLATGVSCLPEHFRPTAQRVVSPKTSGRLPSTPSSPAW